MHACLHVIHRSNRGLFAGDTLTLHWSFDVRPEEGVLQSERHLTEPGSVLDMWCRTLQLKRRGREGLSCVRQKGYLLRNQQICFVGVISLHIGRH